MRERQSQAFSQENQLLQSHETIEQQETKSKRKTARRVVSLLAGAALMFGGSSKAGGEKNHEKHSFKDRVKTTLKQTVHKAQEQFPSLSWNGLLPEVVFKHTVSTEETTTLKAGRKLSHNETETAVGSAYKSAPVDAQIYQLRKALQEEASPSTTHESTWWGKDTTAESVPKLGEMTITSTSSDEYFEEGAESIGEINPENITIARLIGEKLSNEIQKSGISPEIPVSITAIESTFGHLTTKLVEISNTLKINGSSEQEKILNLIHQVDQNLLPESTLTKQVEAVLEEARKLEVSFSKKITKETHESYQLPIWLLLVLPASKLRRRLKEKNESDFEESTKVEHTALNKPTSGLYIETAPTVRLENIHTRSSEYLEILKLNPTFERLCCSFDQVLINDFQDNSESYSFKVSPTGKRTLSLSSRSLIELYEQNNRVDYSKRGQDRRLEWLSNFNKEATQFLIENIPQNNWRPSIHPNISSPENWLPQEGSKEWNTYRWETLVNDLGKYFINNQVRNEGLDYQNMVNLTLQNYDRYADDNLNESGRKNNEPKLSSSERRLDHLTQIILDHWRAHDIKKRLEENPTAQTEDLKDYFNNSDQIKWAKMHAIELLRIADKIHNGDQRSAEEILQAHITELQA